MRYDLTDREDEDRDGRVLSILRAFNREQATEFFELRDEPEHAPVPVRVYAVDGDGTEIGGLLGSTQFAWLKVDILAVAEEHRGHGIGRELLARAEVVARERGCRYAFLDTMSYQGPVFYERCGWTRSGELPDWDSHGHSKFFYVKRLAEPPFLVV